MGSISLMNASSNTINSQQPSLVNSNQTSNYLIVLLKLLEKGNWLLYYKTTSESKRLIGVEKTLKLL